MQTITFTGKRFQVLVDDIRITLSNRVGKKI